MKSFYFFIFLFNLVTCYNGDPIQSYYGTIVGTKITVLGEEMTEYLGIPYAQIPMHSWRFQPPNELKKDQINGTYHAVFKSEGCPQNIRVMGFEGYDASNPKNGTDENCLKLNMWVPNNGEKMPVIVFFHGGSWTVRTGSADKFNGSVLALKTKSIVVVPNFRLGFFGFAYLKGEDGIPGNMGLLDQQMVLRWINRTIENFKGDKNEVTIFGTSSGASSVAAHLFSNNSRLLFKRGIMSSGTITHFMVTVSREIAEANTRNVSKKVGCITNDNEKTINNTEILKCLRNKTVEDLLKATINVSAPGQMPTPFPFMPIDNDTVFFNGSIKDIYKNKWFNKDVDLMVGRTADEATFFMATGFTNNSKFGCYFYPNKLANDTDNQCKMTEQNFKNLVQFGGKILDFNITEIENLQEIYINSASTYTNRSIRILSDFVFDCELSRFAITYTGASSKNTYFYEYNRRSPINPWPEWTGAMHGDDLIDIFGIPFRHPEKYNNETLEREQKYSENVMWAIGNFTKNGVIPNVWDKLNTTEPKALVFNGELGQVGKEKIYTNVTPSTCTEFYKLFIQHMQHKMSKLKSLATTTTTSNLQE